MLSSDCEFTYVTNFILSIIRLVQFNWSIWIYFRYSWLNILGCLRTNRQVRSSHKWMGWWRFEIFRDLCQFQGSFRFNKLYKLYLIYSKNEFFFILAGYSSKHRTRTSASMAWENMFVRFIFEAASWLQQYPVFSYCLSQDPFERLCFTEFKF